MVSFIQLRTSCSCSLANEWLINFSITVLVTLVFAVLFYRIAHWCSMERRSWRVDQAILPRCQRHKQKRQPLRHRQGAPHSRYLCTPPWRSSRQLLLLLFVVVVDGLVAVSGARRQGGNQLAERVVNPGERISIPCFLETPGGSIQWVRNGHPVVLDSTTASRRQWNISKDGTAALQISQVTRADDGLWECWEFADDGSVKRVAKVLKLVVTGKYQLWEEAAVRKTLRRQIIKIRHFVADYLIPQSNQLRIKASLSGSLSMHTVS